MYIARYKINIYYQYPYQIELKKKEIMNRVLLESDIISHIHDAYAHVRLLNAKKRQILSVEIAVIYYDYRVNYCLINTQVESMITRMAQKRTRIPSRT